MKNDKWLIWSTEHHQWWKPNSFGYTPNRQEAGRYTLQEASTIVNDANQSFPAIPNEAIVPE